MSDGKPKKNVAPIAAEQLETLNFKVPADFKKEFNGYAVSQGVSMIELLREGFRLTKQGRSN
jgi:hypothetical protein